MFQLLKWQTVLRYSLIRQQQRISRNVLNLQNDFILEEKAAEAKMDENGKITTVIWTMEKN